MIKLYKIDRTTQQFVELSTGSYEEPLLVSISPGKTAKMMKMYLRNDDESKYYTDLILRPTDSIGQPISSTSIKVKMLSGDREPSEVRWSEMGFNGPPSDAPDSVDPGECSVLASPLGPGPTDTRLPSIGSSEASDTKYYPIWVRVEVSKNISLGDFNLKFSLSYTEGLVG